MPAPIPSTLWTSIRHHWEFDGDTPSFAVAAARAAGDGKAPGRSAVHRRAHDEKWTRQASAADIAAAAQQRADALVNAEAAKKAEDAEYAAQAFERVANERAEVIARHRREWADVRGLVDEALAVRADDPVEAFNRAKLAKITVEAVALRQAAECRAWGVGALDSAGPVDYSKLTDEQLEAISKGKIV